MKNIFFVVSQSPSPEISALQLMCCVGRVAEINCLGSTSSMSSYLILPELGLALVINQILYYLESLRLFFKTLVSKSS